MRVIGTIIIVPITGVSYWYNCVYHTVVPRTVGPRSRSTSGTLEEMDRAVPCRSLSGVTSALAADRDYKRPLATMT